MKKVNLSNALRSARTVVTANSPALLVGTAIVGVIATGVLAAKGGYKARGIVDAAELEKGQPLDFQEKAQLTWLCYAVPTVTALSTIASCVGVHTIHTKRHTALAGLYAVTATKLDDYKDKAEELLGTKKTQQLNDAMAQADVDSDQPGPHNEVIILPGGNELCKDVWGGRFFNGSMPIIEKAFYQLNTELQNEKDVSLNVFYDYVGLDTVPMGDRCGWNGGESVEVRWGSAKTADGRAAISFWFHPEPAVLDASS